MKLSEELKWRGFINQTTIKDIGLIDNTKITFYWGVDPSADSMTIGHLAVAMMIKRWIESGHKAVLLVGGATGLIGDPDGKKQERDLKSVDEVNANVKGLTKQYKQIFNDQDFTTVNNYDWFKGIGFMDFLRDIGKHLSMTQLLDREFVKTRIGEGGSGISYAEFSYSLIQGYDFLHLFRTKGVTLQICGADQWGNSLAGVEMIRKLESGEAHVFSAPLIINKSTGVKFGKSEEGAVWLDETKTSVYAFYQFWLNVDDESVGEFLKIYTAILPDQYNNLMNEFALDRSARVAQKFLAYEVTKIVHGEQKADNARNVSDVLFGQKSFLDLSAQDIKLLATEIPAIKSTNLFDALVKNGLVKSNSEVRRLISSGAIAINGKKISLDTELSTVELNNQQMLVKYGKNSFALLQYK